MNPDSLHVNLLVDPAITALMKAAGRCLDEVLNLVLKLDGALSGEQGIGLAKRDFIDRGISPNSVTLIHAIKRQFDPNGILNPGKGCCPPS